VTRPIFQCRRWSVPRHRKSERKGTDTGTVGPFPAEPMVRILFPPAKSLRTILGEAQCSTNLALAERQLNSLTLLGRKPAANSHVEFEDEMRDALPGVPKTDIGEVVVRARASMAVIWRHSRIARRGLFSMIMSSLRRGNA
jgi:hypothetical protein